MVRSCPMITQFVQNRFVTYQQGFPQSLCIEDGLWEFQHSIFHPVPGNSPWQSPCTRSSLITSDSSDIALLIFPSRAPPGFSVHWNVDRKKGESWEELVFVALEQTSVNSILGITYHWDFPGIRCPVPLLTNPGRPELKCNHSCAFL